ncbi:MAG TPA: helix-turn-helix domain-containing protein, partial [Terriglobales bacterium]|nr:helix-turn-helix domain-containing protein [Terriglobales bacterium]
MSGKISGAVWEMNLPREEKYVLLAYADHADHEGNGVRPSYDLVAWKTGYKKRRVQQVVAKLEAKQILVVVKPGGNLEAGTLGLPTEWYIDVEAAPKLPRRVQRASPSKKGEGATQDTHMRVQRASPKTSVEPKDSVSSLTNVREETRGDVLAKAIEEHGFKPGDAITQGNTVLGLLTQSERGDNPQLSPVAEQTSSDVLILSPSPAAIPKPPRPELKIVPKPEPLIEVRYCDMLRGPKTFTMHLLDINGPGYFKKSVCGAIDDYEMKNGPTPGIEYVWCEKCQAAHSADPAELVNVPP